MSLLVKDNKRALQLTGGISNISKDQAFDTASHHVVGEVKEGGIQAY